MKRVTSCSRLLAQDPVLTSVRTNALEDTPTLSVNIDQEKVGALGLSQRDVDSTLAAAWAGNYVNDFIDRGRVKRVYVQGDSAFRSRPEDLGEWYVRNSSGGMAPFSAFASTAWGRSPATVSRFNGLSAYEIEGAAAPVAVQVRPWLGWRSWRTKSPGLRSRGPDCPSRNGCRAGKRRSCMPSRCWWCSCAWPPCTRAGRFRCR